MPDWSIDDIDRLQLIFNQSGAKLFRKPANGYNLIVIVAKIISMGANSSIELANYIHKQHHRPD